MTVPDVPRTVLVTASRACAEIERYERAVGDAGCRVVARPSRQSWSEDELLPLVAEADAIVCGDDRLTARVLASAPRLKVIVKWGTGLDAIDREAAARHGIEVCNTPGAFSEPVADTVLGYVLLFARGLNRMADDMRAGGWTHLPLRALHDCTLGIIGFGDIGSAVARRAQACRMRVLACDLRTVDESAASALGVEPATFDRVLADSDFVTLHADLRADNRHLIGAAELARMRPSAVLINTARGPLVDEAALVAALTAGRLAGAALDVFEDEPLAASSPLRRLPNVYLAPHNSNSSPAAAERVHVNTIHHLTRTLTGVSS